MQTYLDAAKASMDKNYRRSNPHRVTSTVGLNVGKIETAGISIQFWDLGGQTELQTLWDKVSGTLQITCNVEPLVILCIFHHSSSFDNYSKINVIFGICFN